MAKAPAPPEQPDVPVAPEVAPVPAGPRDVVALDDAARIRELELPPSNLTPGRIPGITPLRQPFVRDAALSTGDLDVYRAPLPLDGRLLLEGAGDRRAGSFEPEGFSLSGPQGRLPFAVGSREGTWGWDAEGILLRQVPGTPPPESRRHKVSSDALAAVERALEFQSSGLDAQAFALRTLRSGDQAWRGLYLPAPGRVTWSLEVPPQAVFDARVVLLAAPVSGSGSDGATAILEVADSSRPEETFELARVDADREGAHLTADLSAYAGREITLRLRTDPGLTRFYDHVLLVGPVVRRREDAPTHVVVIDLGGLGAGTLGVQGNPRPVSPALDRFAERGVLFEQAWAPAPWGPPSLRAILTGVLPGQEATASVASRVREAGFATAAFVAGVDAAALPELLDFEVADLPAAGAAPDLVQAASAFLSRQTDRDALVLLRVDEARLPFEAPAPLRGRFAHEPWRGTPLDLPALRALPADGAEAARAREYLVGRRDQVARGLDDELGKLLSLLRPDARVVVVGDHGVQLWERGGVGAEDALVPETLRVPLILSAPSLTSGRVGAPVSLVSVASTLLDLAGVDQGEGLPGESLLPVAAGRAGVPGATVVVGWPRNALGWGVLADGALWAAGPEGERVLSLVPADAGAGGEATAVPSAAQLRSALGEALGTEVVPVVDVELELDAIVSGFVVRIQHPAGLSGAWLGGGAVDPGLAAPRLEGGAVVYRHLAHRLAPGAILVELPAGSSVDGLQVQVEGSGEPLDLTVSGEVRSTGEPGHAVRVSETWAPRPAR